MLRSLSFFNVKMPSSDVSDPYSTDSDEEYLPENDITPSRKRRNLKKYITLINSDDSGDSETPENVSLAQPSTSAVTHLAASSAVPNVERPFEYSENDSPSDEVVDGIQPEAATHAPQVGKKKKLRQKLWQRNIRKESRTHGHEYVNVKGRKVNAVKMGPNCNCKNQCFEKIGGDGCRKVFSDFYSMTSKDLQDSYLYGLIQRHEIARKRPRSGEGKTKQSSFSYMVSSVITLLGILYFNIIS